MITDSKLPVSQLKTIVALFVILRLTLLFLYTPQGLFNAYTNYHFYYLIAQFTEQGRYPFVNMWYEYPPLSASLPELAYALARRVLPAGDLHSLTYQLYARLLGCIFLVFETGGLVVLHRLAARAWGAAKADWTAWVYASLSVPLFYWNTSHDVLVVFFTLLAMELFLAGRRGGSAVALGLGMAAKLSPVFLLAPVVRFLMKDWAANGKGLNLRALVTAWLNRSVVTYAFLALLTAGAVYLPFALLGGGAWIAASFRSLTQHDSWATVWALMDGNWESGSVGALDARLSLAQSGLAQTHPAVIPGWLTLGVFALGYGWLFFRPVNRRDPRCFIWLATLTVLIMFLWSKGWSPQWSTLLFPLLLLSFPDSRGVKLCLIFTALILLEWPLSDVFRFQVLYATAIIGRTLFFAWVGWLVFKQLCSMPAELHNHAGTQLLRCD